MEEEKNTIITVIYYMKENIQTVKDMEKEKNIMEMVNYILKVNI